jgi:hypothetical protein
MVYAVAPPSVPPAQGPGSFVDGFDRPDAPALNNGWLVVQGGMTVRQAEARNELTSLASLAVQPGTMGSAQTVAMSFASTNNNSGPRLGVVVRYRDAKNYYACYRQVGGTSVVRIVKVQNGVETVLRAASVWNPVMNVSWTVVCQASGSTLSLKVDGRTLISATDASWSTGSVGFLMSSRTASHRGDNFSATVQ